MRSVGDENLSVSRVEAELEGESKQCPFVTSRLEICLKQTLRRHHMVTDGILILFHTKQKHKCSGIILTNSILEDFVLEEVRV